jgi:hypothetical protein
MRGGVQNMTCLLLLLWMSQSASPAEKLPTFQDFVVRKSFKGKPAPVNLASYPGARQFRTNLRKGAPKGPNFAGHYTIVRWGCGTACQSGAIIDAVNGRVFFPFPAPSSGGICFRLDSSLVIVDPIDKETFDSWEGQLPSWLQTRYYNWDGIILVELAATRSIIPSCEKK